MESTWDRIAATGDPEAAVRDLGGLLFSWRGQVLYEQALAFLWIRLNQIVQYGGQFAADADGHRSYLKSRALSDAIVAGILPRIHAIDPNVGREKILDWVASVLDPDVDVTAQDYLNLGMNTIVTIILSFGFGYPRTHEIWDEVGRTRRKMRKEIREARRAKVNVTLHAPSREL